MLPHQVSENRVIEFVVTAFSDDWISATHDYAAKKKTQRRALQAHRKDAAHYDDFFLSVTVGIPAAFTL